MSAVSDFLRQNMLACPWKSHFHLDCPGCGMQRSFAYLLEGDLQKSIEMYPALIPLLLMFGYLLLHIRLKFKKGHKVLVGAFVMNGLLIFTSYTLKFF